MPRTSRHSRSVVYCPKSKKAVRTRRGRKSFIACRPKHPRSPSKGWARKAPKRGRERHLIAKSCPKDKCFLMPEQEKYPICPAYRRRGGKVGCKPSCAGLLSAYRRSRQYKAAGVSRKALSRARKSRCSWTKKSRGRKSRKSRGRKGKH